MTTRLEEIKAWLKEQKELALEYPRVYNLSDRQSKNVLDDLSFLISEVKRLREVVARFESECRKEKVRLKLSGLPDGPGQDNWANLQRLALNALAPEGEREMNFRVGDTVLYFEHQIAPGICLPEFSRHEVREVLPDGIPSCPEPMLMLSGKSGAVLASHCNRVLQQEGEG